MSRGRYELNAKLKACIPDDKNDDRNRVFFTPDDTSKLTYPCITYNRKFGQTNKSNNGKYGINVAYNITIISKGGDKHEDILSNVLNEFMMCSFDNEYVVDGLLHSLLTIYYRL